MVIAHHIVIITFKVDIHPTIGHTTVVITNIMGLHFLLLINFTIKKLLKLQNMVILVVMFQSKGYKIRKTFDQKST